MILNTHREALQYETSDIIRIVSPDNQTEMSFCFYLNYKIKIEDVSSVSVWLVLNADYNEIAGDAKLATMQDKGRSQKMFCFENG